jgi:phospholipid transport system transporter-binding protein
MPRRISPDPGSHPDSGAHADLGCRFETSAGGRASLIGPLTFETVALLFRALEQAPPESAPITQIDLAGVSATDSAGLALLLEWQSRARARGGQFELHNAPEGLLRLARLCEAVDLLNLTGRGPERHGAP